MSVIRFQKTEYLYVLECKGGVTKFGKTIDPIERLAGYRRQKKQKEFRIDPQETFLFLWECEHANVQKIETYCLQALRTKFLNVRSEGFILENRLDLADMVETIVSCAASNGCLMYRHDPRLALHNSSEFIRHDSEMNFEDGPQQTDINESQSYPDCLAPLPETKASSSDWNY